jgi:thymidylate synthase
MDRTGVGTRAVFGYQMRFNMADGFPLVTTKKVATKAIIHELLWFLTGTTNIAPLVEHNVKIWNEWPLQKYLKSQGKTFTPGSDEWHSEMLKFIDLIKSDAQFAQEHGNLGPVYGKQWRAWEGRDGTIHDQISQVLESLKKNPSGRRHIVSAWNVGEIASMALPPCHCLFQFFVDGNTLSLQLYQRSADIFLGVPFNIASYSLLLHLFCQVLGYKPGEFIHTLGDTHLYLNHVEQAALQLTRTPHPLPTLSIDPSITDIFAFQPEHIAIEQYVSDPSIPAPIAV